MSASRIIKRILNVRPASPEKKHVVMQERTNDILMKANEQGERIRRIEGLPRSGNPFGDILERRTDKGRNYA